LIKTNSKYEARNPKQILNVQNPKHGKQDDKFMLGNLGLLFWSFENWRFEFVSSFEIRYSDLGFNDRVPSGGQSDGGFSGSG
jgi:hypothetical protein